MKKLQFLTMFTLGLLMAFSTISCSNAAGDSGNSNVEEKKENSVTDSQKQNVFDFRNKLPSDSSRALQSQAADESKKIYKVTTPVEVLQNYCELAAGEENTIFTFEALDEGDSHKGIKVTYHLPESKKNSGLMGLQIRYLDGNGNYSTFCVPDNVWYPYSSGTDEQKADKVFYFPFVLPNSTVQLVGLASYQNSQDGSTLDYMGKYTLNTKTGLGVIDDLPKGFESDYSHVIINNLKADIKYVIPPVEDITKMDKTINLWYTDNKEDRWDNNSRKCVGDRVIKINSEEEKYRIDYTTDFNSIPASAKQKYIFLQVFYTYKEKGYDGVTFRTPHIFSDLVERSSIKKENNTVKVSDGWNNIDENNILTNFKVTDNSSLSFSMPAIKYQAGGENWRKILLYKTTLKANTTYTISAKPVLPANATLVPSWVWSLKDGTGYSPKSYEIITTSAGQYEITFSYNFTADVEAADITITDFKLEEVTQ